MGYLVGIVATCLAALINPICLIGYVIAGIFVRPFWAAVGIGAVWGIIATAAFALLTDPMPPLMYVWKALGCALGAAIVWWLRGILFPRTPKSA